MTTTTDTASAYTVERKDGQGMNMDGQFGRTLQFIVRHESGEIAWMERAYFSDGLTGRQVNGYRLQASKMAKRLEHHLHKTGQRWEVEQREAREAKKAAYKAKLAAAQALREAAPDLLAACQAVEQAQKDGNYETAFAAVAAAIAKATTPEA